MSRWAVALALGLFARPLLAQSMPTWRERGDLFLYRALGPPAVWGTLPGTAFRTYRDFPAWGRDASGIGRRAASQYGEYVVGEAIEMAVSGLRGEDLRYRRVGAAPMGRRIKMVLARVVVARNAEGRWTPALGRIANEYGGRAVASRWGPPETQTVRSVLRYGSTGLATSAGANAFREFWPDVKKRFSRKP